MSVPRGPPAKSVIDRIEPVGVLADRPPALRCDQLHVDGAGQPGGNLILHVERIAALLIEAFGPQMRAALGIDELSVEPDPLARVLHAAFEHVAHAELATDLTGVDRLALIGESGVARDREDARTAREVGRQRLGDAVDEGVVLGAPTDIEEGAKPRSRVAARRARR